MEVHFPASKVAKDSWKLDNSNKHKTTDPSCYKSSKFKGIVTKEKAAFRQLGSLKAAGPDEIKLIVLKNLLDITLETNHCNLSSKLRTRFHATELAGIESNIHTQTRQGII